MVLSCSLWLVLLVPIIAIIAKQALFAGIDAPPSDFGSGSMFDVIARRYDLLNRVLALGMDVGWRQTMVGLVKESVEDIEQPVLLDVATGTADVAILLATAMPTAKVMGVDPSSNMLDIGRQKVRQQSLDSTIELRLADAQDFSVIDSDSFDAATMAFGIRNVPDRSRALCEIHRVLKAGRRFCILEFSEPDEEFGIMGTGARFFIRHVVPVVGGILSGAPREYWHLQNSIQDFPPPKEFRENLESLECQGAAAFDVEEVRHLNFGSVQIYTMKTKKRAVNEETSTVDAES